MSLNIHQTIKEKLDYFHKIHKIPNIIFHGPSGTGKRSLVNDFIHKNSNWKVFIHSCGSIRELIPDLIDAGFDILNPVQCSAAGMDAKELKKEFGKDLVFWGGGVDTQKTIPFGTPKEVYDQVRERIKIFNDPTGMVFNTIHNIQAGTPVENILAMFEAIKDSGK